jgi:Tfp pilus assembly protein PilV
MFKSAFSFVKAFSLIEVMIAAAILLISIVTLLFIFVSCGVLNESNGNLITAAVDAQNVLEQIRNLSYSQIDDFIDNFSSTTFSNLDNETVAISNSETDGLMEVTVNVNWTDRGRAKNFSLTTKFAR